MLRRRTSLIQVVLACPGQFYALYLGFKFGPMRPLSISMVRQDTLIMEGRSGRRPLMRRLGSKHAVVGSRLFLSLIFRIC